DGEEKPKEKKPRRQLSDKARQVTEEYNKAMRSSRVQVAEAMWDSMKTLKEFMQITSKAAGRKLKDIADVEGFMNPYLGENRLPSVNKHDQDMFKRRHLDGLYKAIDKLTGGTEEGRRGLFTYMKAKHGLERNLLMAEREARKAYEARKKKADPSWEELDEEKRQGLVNGARRDYAGLTGLFTKKGEKAPSWQEAERMARECVESYEADHDTGDLWKRVKKLTDAILKKERDTGLISTETYDRVRSMYRHYIPLRGFMEPTADQMYAYIGQPEGSGGFSDPMKGAKGRTSEADDPITSLVKMAQSAIIQGNRNQNVRLPLLRFVRNHAAETGDLVSVSGLWLRRDAGGGWNVARPEDVGRPDLRVTDQDGPDETRRKQEELEELYRQAAAADPENFRMSSDDTKMPFRAGEGDLGQHQVLVKEGGKTVLLTVKGSPRLAQAVNGLTNPDVERKGFSGWTHKVTGTANRFLAKVHTTLNPDFVAGNLGRDMQFANSRLFMKEGAGYTARFDGNMARLGGPLRVGRLLWQHERGTLDESSEVGRWFGEYMRNGGETGYTALQDNDKVNKEYLSQLVGAHWDNKALVGQARELSRGMARVLGDVGRAVEISTRFAAYMTSRQEGRSVARSVWDSKEATANFNKKGAGDRFLGAKGQTRLGNIAAGVSGWGRDWIMFWNASVQGMRGMAEAATMSKASMARAVGVGAGFFIYGMANAMFHHDDDEYYNMPDWVRRNNLMLPKAGGVRLIYPMSQELQPFYGMGELLGSYMSGREKGGWNLTLKGADILMTPSPVNLLEGQRDDGKFDWGMAASQLAPSFAQSLGQTFFDTSWNGMPLDKRNPYNQDYPNYTKAYQGTGRGWVLTSRAAYNGTDGAIDLNPGAMQYLFRQTVPFGNFYSELAATGRMAVGAADFDIQNIPLVNRFGKSENELSEGRALRSYFYETGQAGRRADRDLWRNKWELENHLITPEEKRERDAEVKGGADYIMGQLYKSQGKDIREALKNKALGKDVSQERLDKALRRYRDRAREILERKGISEGVDRVQRMRDAFQGD
ncbi:MAG: hypothetical protein LUC33_01670, partial [Prevotellaceae bacterium]|nr:hypothetical protein [Prevotellaceae bacterium]